MKFRLCCSAEELLTYSSRPEFLSSTIFNPNLVGVNLAKDKVKLDKPIFIGQAVLDISKLIMYNLYYDQLIPMATRLGGSIKILGGDTDSFFLQTRGINVEGELLPLLCRENLLDSSNYPTNHPLYSDDRRAKLGCIKDEAAGKPFREWILLRPKAYSMLTVDGRAIKRAKGVRRSTLSLDITHATYKEAFQQQTTFSHIQRRIGSVNHQIYNMVYRKRTLSFFEDKRAWSTVNRSVPFGNHMLQNAGPRPQKRKANNLPRLVEPTANKRAHMED